MAENTNTEQWALEELGFYLDDRDGVWVVFDDGGEATPANLTERVLWDALKKARASLSLPAAGQEPVAVNKEVFEFWWADHMPNATQAEAWAEWVTLMQPAAPQPAAQVAGQEPMFWVRLCGDGLYEGPIHNARIEEVRRQSGAWSPLYLGAAPQPAVAAGWMPIETAPKGEKVLLAGRDRKPCIDDWALYCRINQPGFTHWMPLPPAPSTEGESNG